MNSCFVECMHASMTDTVDAWIVRWLVCRMPGWMNECMGGQFVTRMVGCMDDWMCSWMVGWLV